MKPNKVIATIAFMILIFSAWSYAEGGDLPDVKVKLEKDRIVCATGNKTYFYPLNEYDGIKQLDAENDLDKDGKNEFVIGIQLHEGEADIPYGVVLICEKDGEALKIVQKISVGDYFKKFDLLEIGNTKGDLETWILIWGNSGMHCDEFRILTYNDGKFVTLADKSSPAGIEFKQSDKGVPQIWVGSLDENEPDANYADNKRIWRVSVWDGEKFVYDPALSTKEPGEA